MCKFHSTTHLAMDNGYICRYENLNTRSCCSDESLRFDSGTLKFVSEVTHIETTSCITFLYYLETAGAGIGLPEQSYDFRSEYYGAVTDELTILFVECQMFSEKHV